MLCHGIAAISRRSDGNVVVYALLRRHLVGKQISRDGRVEARSLRPLHQGKIIRFVRIRGFAADFNNISQLHGNIGRGDCLAKSWQLHLSNRKEPTGTPFDKPSAIKITRHHIPPDRTVPTDTSTNISLAAQAHVAETLKSVLEVNAGRHT